MADILPVEATKLYGVVVNNKLLGETVSPTIRAAKVNYLVTFRGIAITMFYSDKKIDETWDYHAPRTGATLVEFWAQSLRALDD